MGFKEQITSLIELSLNPTHLEVIDESHMHSRGQETHFKVIVVSQGFQGLRQVQRQQLVYKAVKTVFEQGLHALAQSTFTPEEWLKGVSVNASPVCAGAGHKKD